MQALIHVPSRMITDGMITSPQHGHTVGNVVQHADGRTELDVISPEWGVVGHIEFPASGGILTLKTEV